MEHSDRVISLWKFPTDPFSIKRQQQISVSPKTKAILKEADVNLQQILPLSMAQFIRINNLEGNPHQYIREIYSLEESRRISKINILQQIWKKQAKRQIQKRLQSSQKNRKSKSAKKFGHNPIKSVYLHVPKSLACSRQYKSLLSQFLRDSRTSQKSRNSQLGRKIVNNKKWQPQYFTKRSGKKSFEQQSTKSRKKSYLKYDTQVKNAQLRPEYFTLSSGCKPNKKPKVNTQKRQSLNKMRKPSTSNYESARMYQQLFGIMRKWDQLDQKHQIQNQQMDGVSQIQKKRLQKLQNIEKQYFRQEVQDLKKVIRSKTNKI